MGLSDSSATITLKNSCWRNGKLPDLWLPLRHWLNSIQVRDSRLAGRICHLIPAQCPFARKIKLWGRTLLTVPPLCQVNPLYEELMALRFRAICFLAEECGEDVSAYC